MLTGGTARRLQRSFEKSPQYREVPGARQHESCPVPYVQIIEANRQRDKHTPEYELLDTGIFDEDRYFDVFVEYAKHESPRTS